MSWRNEYEAYLIDSGRSAKTVEAYCRDVDLYARWFRQVNDEPFAPRLLCGPDLREYRTYSLDVERVSAATWNRRLASLKVFAAWSQMRGYIVNDPMRGVLPEEQVELPPYWLSPEEFRRLRRQLEINVNTARTEAWRRQAIRDRAMIALMLYAGLRVSEVVRLTPDDLLLRLRSGYVQVRGKGGKQARIELGREARRALTAWLEIRPGGAALFVGKGTERLSTRQVERRVRAVGQAAGIDDLRPHRLRHTFIRRLAVNDDGSPKHPGGWVRDMARHSRSTTTERYYQASRDDRQAMVENL